MPDTAAASMEIDGKALREKYREEREKRLRIDGNDQYIEVAGEYAKYLDDPYTQQTERAPLTDHTDVIIIGGGFGGLIAGARLREAEIEDIRMIEKGGDFGGTWYWNRYPGAACDIESYSYLPLLEETGHMPSQRYATAPNILDHSRRIAEQYRLYDNACLQTEVTAMTWDEDRKLWVIETNRDDRMTARFVLMSNGPLHRPKLPGIPGIETFNGHTFHTSRWDYDYTGGGPEGGLDKIGDKRIGIIGTGATSVQCVPHLGKGAKELYVFQRTPSSVDERNNRPTDPDWVASLEPGWQRRRMENFNILVSGGYQDEDLVNDGWTALVRNIVQIARERKGTKLTKKDMEELAELADYQKMEQVRARAEELVDDPATSEALKPWYRLFCKRPCFHDDYLPTFNRENVTLVDTQGKGVERIEGSNVIANGKSYELDCLVFATGFEVGTDYARRCGYELVGRGGKTLTEAWADGVVTLFGMNVRDFPNVFILGGAQSGFTANYPHLLDEQASHIAWLLSDERVQAASTLEPSQNGQAHWVKQILDKARLREEFLNECTPGYYNDEGKLGKLAVLNGFYGAGSPAYFDILAAWRKAGDLQGLELSMAD